MLEKWKLKTQVSFFPIKRDFKNEKSFKQISSKKNGKHTKIYQMNF